MIQQRITSFARCLGEVYLHSPSRVTVDYEQNIIVHQT